MDEEGAQRDAAVVVAMDDLMREGLPVFDLTGARIGPVYRYDLEAGYMVVEHGAFSRRRFYIPFHLIRSITPKKIYLAVAQAMLTDDFLQPPAIKPVVEEWTNPLTGRTEMVILHEVRSGYDGRLVRVMPVSVEEVTERITIGMTVLDVDDDYVGEIIDRDEERLIARNDIAGDTTHIVPFGFVASVNLEDLTVNLLVPKVALPCYTSSQGINAQGTGGNLEARQPRRAVETFSTSK
jgi:hypothetical protein